MALLICAALGACTKPKRAPPPDEWQESRQRAVEVAAPPSPPAASAAPPFPIVEGELVLREVAVAPRRPPPAAFVVSAKPLARPPPNYPPMLVDEALEGRVVASFIVNKAGRVESVEIERSTHAAFGDAVRAALASWRFEPARSATGAPVPSQVRVPFRFRLEE